MVECLCKSEDTLQCSSCYTVVTPAFKVGRYLINHKSPCFIIAEIGHNHQGSMELCKKMIVAAASSGAHAVKLQKRDNKELFTKAAYDKPYDNENSFGKTYGEHREALEFDQKQYMELKAYAEDLGLVFFATPFDIPSVDFLDQIDVPCYKVASALITDTVLLEYIARKGKPVFLSTGACLMQDIDKAYALLSLHCPVCVMHCVASYPMMDYKEANMKMIATLQERYPYAVIGFSSHESGIMLPIAAYMLGARVVEKHFTLNRAMKGTDQKFSLEPSGLEKMARDLKRIHESIGDGEKSIQSSELDAKRKLGKSLVARVAIVKGTVLLPEMVAFKSPGDGLPIGEVYHLLGRTALQDIGPDELLTAVAFSTESVPSRGKNKRINWGVAYGKII